MTSYSNRAPSLIRWLTPLFFLVFLFSGCSRSYGTLKNKSSESFEPFAEADQGSSFFWEERSDDPMHGVLMRVDLRNGEIHKTLPDAEIDLVNISENQRTWTFRDAKENFYIWTPETGLSEAIRELNGTTIDTHLSPDGTQLAFKHPEESDVFGPTGNRLHIMNLNTKRIATYPTQLDHPYSNFKWSKDSRSVLMGTEDENTLQLIDAKTGAITAFYSEDEMPEVGKIYRSLRDLEGGKTTCDKLGGAKLSRSEYEGGSIDIIHPDGRETRLVTIKGNRRGSFDSADWGSTQFFTPSCKNVIFTHGSRVMMVNVEDKQVFHIGDGFRPFSLEK